VGRPVQGRDTPPVRQAVFMFQPMLAALGVQAAAAIQPFNDWFDGLNVNMVQFKVEILAIGNAKLILESSPFAEEDASCWEELAAFTARPTDGFEIVTAVSDSTSSQAGKQFSRYIRWRIVNNSTGAWKICFRIKAVLGSTFTQTAEVPRRV
jgi:hypothetical protein